MQGIEFWEALDPRNKREEKMRGQSWIAPKKDRKNRTKLKNHGEDKLGYSQKKNRR